MLEDRGNINQDMDCVDPNTPSEATMESSYSQPPPRPPQVLLAGSSSNSKVDLSEMLSLLNLPPPSSAADMMHAQGGNNNNHGGFATRFPSEVERRYHFNNLFINLKNLLPCPKKYDRASIVKEATEYIKELLRLIEELKIIIGKKKGSEKKIDITDGEKEEDIVTNGQTSSEVDQSCFSNKKCPWLKRISNVAEVYVNITEDKVIIKLEQKKKKINSLLFTTKVLDQLQLDIHHIAGGQIGEHCHSFLFHAKIREGSCVHANEIADRVMEVVEKQ